MFKNSSSFFISLTIHAMIALLAVMMYQKVHVHLPVLEKRVCVSLTHCVEAVPVVPEPKVVQPKPKPAPPIPKKVKPVQPIKPKPVSKPKPIVKPKPKPLPALVAVTEAVVEPVAHESVEIVEIVESPEPITASSSIISDQPSEAIPAVSAEESYMKEHLAMIAKLLRENLYYPKLARKRGITGDVIVAFELQKNGEATNIKVKSGERDILNRAAVTTIERLSGEFPKPEEPINLHIPIRYQLQ